VPIKNIIRRETSSGGSSYCSNLSTNLSDLLSANTGVATANSSTSRTSSTDNKMVMPRHNGWSVPLGVHKIICRGSGLKVGTQVHRRSVPVKVMNGDSKTRVDLVIPPESYVEILETQVHGERVRGRICWEAEESIIEDDYEKKKSKKRSIKKRTSRLLKRTSRKNKEKRAKSPQVTVTKYEGWISLQWAKQEENEHDNNGDNDGEESCANANNNDNKEESNATDEDSGPWTEPVPLGVYRINFGGGLPLRETPERDSPVLGKLDRGRCVEVVQTQVKGDRVRARIIVTNDEKEEESSLLLLNNKNNNNGGNKQFKKFTSGWISLLNALTGSSGASPVPLGAYVVVAEPACVITEGGRLDSKVKGTLVPGSCMEVVATRMEEGVVRGLIEGGGHVTLFVPPRNNASSAKGTNNHNSTANNTANTNNNASGNNNSNSGRKNSDGGRMFAMPVPLGTYQIIQSGLSVTTGISSTSSILMKIQLNATAEIIETRVEDGRVRGRICAVVNEDGTRVVGYEKAAGMRSGSSTSSTGTASNNASGWIHLFEPNQRWAKIVCFKGGRPVVSQSRRQSSTRAAS